MSETEGKSQDLFESFLFLASEAKMPRNDNTEKIRKPVLIPAISPGYVEGLIDSFPR